MAHRRLRSWGLNTIANWSDPDVYRQRRTPYVATVHTQSGPLEGSQGYWGQFPDVFDPGFRAGLKEQLAERSEASADPWCIGFFVDNELGWGDEVSLAQATLASPPDQVAKQVFVERLRRRYGDIAALNDAWETAHGSWEALAQSREPAVADGAAEDLRAFSYHTARTYFRTVREEVDAAAPGQLYLGCRFAWVNDLAARAAVEFCHVVSYNRYQYSVDDVAHPDGADHPVVIGEFHFGALDRGLFHTGLKGARDQGHRAQLYRDYVTGALRHPLIVGAHWFQYRDQPATGRGDGENYQIGFVDMVDTPYPELVAASRQVGREMYEIRSGPRNGQRR